MLMRKFIGVYLFLGLRVGGVCSCESLQKKAENFLMYKSPGATDPFMRRHWKAKHATKSVSNNERSLTRRMEGLSAVNVVALLY